MNINFVSARAGLLGAALVSLCFGLNGCGGGGSGPSSDNSTVTATPRPQATSTNNQTGGSCTNTTYTPNYTGSVRLLHWTLFPLRVFFVRDTNYSAARQQLAIQGFNRWVVATGSNGVTYNVVNNADDANVTVKFYKFTGGAGDTLGTTEVSYFDDSDTIDGADISLGITGQADNDLLTATHEFGHALGIFGHSPNDADIMYFEGNEAKGGILTASDLNTVLTAYCGNFNKNSAARVSPHAGEKHTITIH